MRNGSPNGGNTYPKMCDCFDKRIVKGKLVLCGLFGGIDTPNTGVIL
jgi:hypothetical protein